MPNPAFFKEAFDRVVSAISPQTREPLTAITRSILPHCQSVAAGPVAWRALRAETAARRRSRDHSFVLFVKENSQGSAIVIEQVGLFNLVYSIDPPEKGWWKMTAYELLCNTGRAIIKGQVFSDNEKKEISKTFLSCRDAPETVHRFLASVKALDAGRMMYPLFFIPPYNGGRKQRLITGQMPKTHLFSANHYELEILRLLALWDSENDLVAQMVEQTLARLDATCFGHFCSEGECVGASVSVLRFLSAVKNIDEGWIAEILNPLGDLFSAIQGQAATNKNLPVFYFCLALSGIKSDIAAQIIRKRKDFLLTLLRRGWLTGPAENDKYTPLSKYVLRNTLASLPEFEYLRNAEIYISAKDGRVYCDV